MPDILISAFIGLGGFAAGGVTIFLVQQRIASRKFSSVEEKAKRLLNEAKEKEKEILLEAKEEGIKVRTAADAEYRDRRSELQRQEKRLSQKEEGMERKLENLERRDQTISAKEGRIDTIHAELDEIKQKQLHQLETISAMPVAAAKEVLLKRVEEEIREDEVRRFHEMEAQFKEEADKRAQEILVGAIQRCATEVVTETTVSVVPLPGDEMKGRLIGREGRNIRALEHATGVELIIDDTPETVALSSFDPVRREIARVALTKLILDGRIHPARIEEMVQKAKSEVEATIQSEGEQAAYKVGVQRLHPELIKLLGRLKYRTSYGQNVLAHSIEVALLAGMIAVEIGFNVELAKRAGLLHDIGKAVDFEVEGTHAAIGANLARQWEKSPEIVQAIAEHHGETETTSMGGFIVSAADALSGGRPGARRESLEHYLKRLHTLEEVANSFPGVDKSYAIQAGREIRIMVKPDETDDLQAMRLARDIAKKIEDSLEYPGQIKVTVIREKRVVDYAK